MTVAAGQLSEGCEIRAFYPDKAADPVWEIRPLRSVTLTGANFVLVFDRHQAVLESLQEALVPTAVEGTTDGNFLTTVDIYRVFNDPQGQADLLWEPLPSCPFATNVSCVICQDASQTGCLIARGDPGHTILAYHPATWNSTTEQFDPTALVQSRQPDLIRMWYYAGHQAKEIDCNLITMDPYWAVIVAHFAAALLRKPPCECNKLDFEHWLKDLAFAGGVGESSIFNPSPCALPNPFWPRPALL